MNLVLYPHGGSGNHGCEAIVRSTCKITQAEISLFSAAPEEDKIAGLDKICRVSLDHEPISKSSIAYLQALWQS